MLAGEIQEYMDFVLPLVLQSGKELLGIDSIKSSHIEIKSDVSDLVTIYDRKIESLLIRKLSENYPNHKFIGEEESADKKQIPELTDFPTWIIDPIDGTMNFVKKMPITAISVALVIKRIQVLGIVYNPYADELFTAVKGQGAFLNGNKISTSGVTDIKKSVLNMELSIAIFSSSLRNTYLARFNQLVDKLSGIRSYGCAALGLCYVACGRVDAYQADGLYSWDTAAGTLIAQEAGGFVIDPTGKTFDLMRPNVLATATKELGNEFLENINQADRKL